MSDVGLPGSFLEGEFETHKSDIWTECAVLSVCPREGRGANVVFASWRLVLLLCVSVL